MRNVGTAPVAGKIPTFFVWQEGRERSSGSKIRRMKNSLQRVRVASSKLGPRQQKALAFDVMTLLHPTKLTSDVVLQANIRRTIQHQQRLRRARPAELIEVVAAHLSATSSLPSASSSSLDTTRRAFPLSFAEHAQIVAYVVSQSALSSASLLESLQIVLGSAGAAAGNEFDTLALDSFASLPQMLKEEMHEGGGECSGGRSDPLENSFSLAPYAGLQPLVDVAEELAELLSSVRSAWWGGESLGDVFTRCVALPLLSCFASLDRRKITVAEEWRRLLDATLLKLRISFDAAVKLIPFVLCPPHAVQAGHVRCILNQLANGGRVDEILQVQQQLKILQAEEGERGSSSLMSLPFEERKQLISETELLLKTARINSGSGSRAKSTPAAKDSTSTYIADLAHVVAAGVFPQRAIRYSDFAHLLKQFGVALTPAQQLSPSAVWSATRAVPLEARRVLAFTSFQIQSRQRLAGNLSLDDIWYAVTCMRSKANALSTGGLYTVTQDDILAMCESFLFLTKQGHASVLQQGSLSLLMACANDLLLLLFELGFPRLHVAWLASITAFHISNNLFEQLLEDERADVIAKSLSQALSNEMPLMAPQQQRELAERLHATGQELLSGVTGKQQQQDDDDDDDEKKKKKISLVAPQADEIFCLLRRPPSEAADSSKEKEEEEEEEAGNGLMARMMMTPQTDKLKSSFPFEMRHFSSPTSFGHREAIRQFNNNDRSVGHILTATMWAEALELFYKSTSDVQRVTAPYVLRLTIRQNATAPSRNSSAERDKVPAATTTTKNPDQLLHDVFCMCVENRIPLEEELVNNMLQRALRQGAWRQGLQYHSMITTGQPSIGKSPSIQRSLDLLLRNMMLLSECSGQIAALTRSIRKASWESAALLAHEHIVMLSNLPQQLAPVVNAARYAILKARTNGKRGREEEVDGWKRALEQLPLPPDGRAMQDALEILQELAKNGDNKMTPASSSLSSSRGSGAEEANVVSSTAATSTALILDGQASVGTTSSSLQIGLRRRSRHFMTDFDAHVSGFYKEGKWRDAIALYKNAAQLSIPVSAHNVVRLCMFHGRWEQSLVVFEDLARRRRPDARTTLAALDACAIGLHWIGALRILRFTLMSQSNPPPLIIHGALAAAAASGHAHSALSICRKLMQANSTNPLIVESVMECLYALKLHNEIVEYFYQVMTRGVRPLDRTLEIAIVASEAATGECRQLALTVHGLAWALEDVCRVTGAILEHVLLVQQSSGETRISVAFGRT